jgi:hypothetical protein
LSQSPSVHPVERAKTVLQRIKPKNIYRNRFFMSTILAHKISYVLYINPAIGISNFYITIAGVEDINYCNTLHYFDLKKIPPDSKARGDL